MNLLQIQDALKGASDQQLIQEMQRPSGAVPQYLVLSELDRRKNMRAQVQGQTPDTTIAEDTVAGIASLAPHRMIDPDVEEQRRDEDGISAFREGGVIHMQAGGLSPDISSMSLDELRRTLYPQTGRSPYAQTQVAPEMADAIRRRIDELETQQEQNYMTRPRSQLRRDLESVQDVARNAAIGFGGAVSNLGTGAANLGQRAWQYATEPVATPLLAGQNIPGPEFYGDAPAPYADVAVSQPASTASAAAGTASGAAPNPFAGGASNAAPQGTQAPGARGTSNPPGGGGGRAAAAPGGAAATGGAPTWEGIRDRVIGDTPDQLRAMAEEIRRGRPNSEERRNEALNMALIEAGLRIAGSQSPHFAQALSEGAVPAIQGYTRAVGDIRKEAREATKDELEVRMAQITNMYRAGQISASLYNIERDSIDKELDRRQRERTAGMTASEAARDRAERAAADREARREIARGQQESDVLRSLEHRIKQDRESINSTGFRLLNTAQQKEIRDRLAVDEANYNRIVNTRVAAIPGAVRSLEELRASVR